MKIAIRTEVLRKTFGANIAVAGATFSVAAGEMFALLGPNGAGKSTLIRMLTTLVEPTSGRAIVAGHDVRREPDAVRKSIGVIPQAMTSDPDMTAAENLDFYAKLYGVATSARRRMVDELLEKVDLVAFRNNRVGTFSGGMRRRLEIARSLMHEPLVLFLDEPTTGLDPASRLAMWEMIRKLKAHTGVTVFLTTHYMEEADQLCDRVAIFDRGVVVALDAPSVLKAKLNSDVVQATFSGAGPLWAETIRSLPGVLELRIEGDAYRIRTMNGVQTIDALLARARHADVSVTTLAASTSSLEDVFISYTGRELRDDPSTNSRGSLPSFAQARRSA